ncbi:N-acetyl-gamma-glutamyl-phosphate reductase [Comamonas thiooxydans]|uniref:N-acetyl-gamma-glutamyl-phosphate reductase n=1 Tax=Comamonas thiooxydans TaxID=363952 RepID=UPI000B413DA5|nr:N-acetyl-gamma-glutamyl-phosphate reductase [Comamonas thiooxydans]
MTRIFIDGSHGTVGRNLTAQLRAADLGAELLTLENDLRKDEAARAEAMREADIVVICVPDDAARDAVQLAQRVNPSVRLLDASATHRCDPNWIYGLSEIRRQGDLRNAQLVANPGCFATGCILLGLAIRGGYRPLKAVFHGVTGYTAAGNKGEHLVVPTLAQFGKSHRHLPEIARYGGVKPVLTTMVGPWPQGMLIQTHIEQGVDETLTRLGMLYSNSRSVDIVQAGNGVHRLEVGQHNGTNRVSIMVAGQPAGGVSLACCYDNLGKGSAGAALQNLKEMMEAA